MNEFEIIAFVNGKVVGTAGVEAAGSIKLASSRIWYKFFTRVLGDWNRQCFDGSMYSVPRKQAAFSWN